MKPGTSTDVQRCLKVEKIIPVNEEVGSSKWSSKWSIKRYVNPINNPQRSLNTRFEYNLESNKELENIINSFLICFKRELKLFAAPVKGRLANLIMKGISEGFPNRILLWDYIVFK